MPTATMGIHASHTSQDVLESQLDVAGVEGRGLDEGEVVLAWDGGSAWRDGADMVAESTY